MAEGAKALVLLPQVGLMLVQILVTAMNGNNVWNIGKPLNSVPYIPQQYRWKTSDVKPNGGW